MQWVMECYFTFSNREKSRTVGDTKWEILFGQFSIFWIALILYLMKSEKKKIAHKLSWKHLIRSRRITGKYQL